MQIAFTFRNFEASESLKDCATEKLAKLQKYLHTPLSASLTFSLERHAQCVDLLLHGAGETFVARAECQDMYASIDQAVDKLRVQLRRNKDAQTTSRRDSTPA